MEKGRILVVDDDVIISRTCKRILSSEGFIISTAGTGEDAIKKISSEEFNLVITDVRLPDIHGLEILKETVRIQPGSDVVVITGYPSLEDARESIKLGALEYLEKPFTPEFLINTVNKIFDKRGWILRKGYIDKFRNMVVPLSEIDERTIFYKEGTWARPLKDGLWEIGTDVRYWFIAGNMLYLEMSHEIRSVKAGEPFARLLVSDGRIFELFSPMSGTVKRVNERANEVMCALSNECISEGWLLWLLKIDPLKL